VCYEIAKTYFGEEGVRTLEEAYKGVEEAVDRCRANPEQCAKEIQPEPKVPVIVPLPESPKTPKLPEPKEPVACPTVMPRTAPCLPGQTLKKEVLPNGCISVGTCEGSIPSENRG